MHAKDNAVFPQPESISFSDHPIIFNSSLTPPPQRIYLNFLSMPTSEYGFQLLGFGYSSIVTQYAYFKRIRIILLFVVWSLANVQLYNNF